MDRNLTANDLHGRAIGGTFFTGFGAIWLGLSLYIRQLLSTVTLTALVTGTLILLLGCLWVSQQADRWPTVADDPEVRRSFQRVNTAQWIAIALVAVSFARLHMDSYAMSAITAIVGVHLFPLARLFRRPLHLASGGALVLWASGTVLMVPVEHMQWITAMGTGIILWMSAAASLGQGILLARGREAYLQNSRSRLIV